MKCVSKVILGTSGKPMVIKLAVDLLKSTNGGTVDFAQHKQFQHFLFRLAHKVILFNSGKLNVTQWSQLMSFEGCVG